MRTDETLVMLGDHLGSVAAVRNLGECGVNVVFADHRRFTPGGWSRYVTRRVTAPAPSDLSAYAAWLLETGRRHPGMFLYAANDDLCWVLARHRAQLSVHFRMFQPDLKTIYTLLNKQRLSALAGRLGIPTPSTWAPDSEESLTEVANAAHYPVLIKPRTQIGLASKQKGVVCANAAELLEHYARFRRANTYHAEVEAHDPSVSWPLVQAFLPTAAANILSVAGFRDRDGHLALRASQKVFQRPRRVGVGVGFEARPVPEQAAAWVRSLCEAAGYFGVFEVEFLVDGDGRLYLADFNPRYYGQMAFEIARGLPQARLAWLGAMEATVELERALAVAAAPESEAGVTRFAHGWVLRLMAVMQRLGGRLSGSEFAAWRRWWTPSTDAATADAVWRTGDPAPALVDIIWSTFRFARHPRAFVRSFCLDG